jgi:hypothetical protein
MCPRCEIDPKPENFVDSRRCAFDADGKFTPDNWNCGTIDALIGDDPIIVYGHDEQFEATPTHFDDELNGGWIITTRYKRRGRTSSAFYTGDFSPPLLLTLDLADRVIHSRNLFDQWRKEQAVTPAASEAQ